MIIINTLLKKFTSYITLGKFVMIVNLCVFVTLKLYDVQIEDPFIL